MPSDSSPSGSTLALIVALKWDTVNLSKRIQSSEQAQLAFAKMSKGAGLEGGTLWNRKKYFGPKLFLGGREHFLYLVPTQNFEF